MTTEEKDKAIEIDDNNGHQADDDATLIVNETLKELQKVKIEVQDIDTEMVEKKLM